MTEVRAAVLRRAMIVVLMLGMGAAFLIFTHSFVRWYARDYYFDHLVVLSALAFCVIIACVWETTTRLPVGRWLRARWHPLLGYSLSLLVVLYLAYSSMLQGALRLSAGAYPWQVDMGDAGQWLAQHTRRTDIAASFNAGIIAYLSTRSVVNLDGVADNAAFAAIRDRDLIGFMERSHVRYYVDWDPIMLHHWYAPFLGMAGARVHMTALATFTRSGIVDPGRTLRLYRLRWAARQPRKPAVLKSGRRRRQHYECVLSPQYPCKGGVFGRSD
jgi:hypothetical protein